MFISGKNNKIEFNVPNLSFKINDNLILKEKIIKMTPDERRRLGIGKSTLFYVKKNLQEGKSVKIYDKVFNKLN